MLKSVQPQITKKKEAEANVIKLIMLEFKSDDISADILF